MSYLTQMAGLAWHNFISAAVGIAIALAFARGLTYHLRPAPPRRSAISGSISSAPQCMSCCPSASLWRWCWSLKECIQNFSSYVDLTTLEGVKQTLAMGPVASQEVIKELGTNGGGFFNANSAHPFENPTPLTNFIEMVLIFAIPAALTYTYGRMARDQKQGWALFAAMALCFFMGVSVAYYYRGARQPGTAQPGGGSSRRKLEGKEVRFGIANSAPVCDGHHGRPLAAPSIPCTIVSPPLGGLVPSPIFNLVSWSLAASARGSTPCWSYVLLSVFIAGLMVGRTPEYLGKKIEAREVKLAMLYVLIFPLLILYFAGWSAVAPYGVSSLNNTGPHGLSEILYAYSSAAGTMARPLPASTRTRSGTT